MHDWGAVGLLAAIERPEAIEKIVLIDAVPFLPGYRWHTVARAWRKPVLGELLMGASTKWALNRFSALPGAEVDRIWKHWDHGTQRAILKLYRSAPEHALAAAGLGLPELRSRSLVVWGDRDPYLPERFAHGYAEALGGELHMAEGAGHWPWLDQPGVIDRVAAFLSG
jgi:pimeloyl-ACP methyl ester carboxylesterase